VDAEGRRIALDPVRVAEQVMLAARAVQLAEHVRERDLRALMARERQCRHMQRGA
jgi:hypothetical protein